jgi:hypothetical protein
MNDIRLLQISFILFINITRRSNPQPDAKPVWFCGKETDASVGVGFPRPLLCDNTYVALVSFR